MSNFESNVFFRRNSSKRELINEIEFQKFQNFFQNFKFPLILSYLFAVTLSKKKKKLIRLFGLYELYVRIVI